MQNLRIYRAKNTNDGVASEWQLAFKEKEKFDKFMVFLSLSRQVPNEGAEDAKFDWKNSLKVKLGQNDIGELLAVLLNFQESAGNGKGLFHQTDKGNKVINFSQGKNGGYYLKVSYQSADKTENDTRQHSISQGEGQVLRIFLEECLRYLQGCFTTNC